MKTLIAVALVAAFAPTLAAAMSRPEPVRERRHCTQISARAGSHMPGRRICRTATSTKRRTRRGISGRSLISRRKRRPSGTVAAAVTSLMTAGSAWR